jgi:hypothetical protein
VPSVRWIAAISDPQTLETKLSLLHQVGDRGDPDIVVRICTALLERPPVRYPESSDAAACWRFLLEMARPAAIPRALGMLGKLPEWVAKLKKIYEDADVHALESDVEGFHRATEAGRRHLAEIRTVAGAPEPVERDPRLVMRYLTNELTAWLLSLYRRSASSLGLTDYVLMAVGSAAFPQSRPHSKPLDHTRAGEQNRRGRELRRRACRSQRSVAGGLRGRRSTATGSRSRPSSGAHENRGKSTDTLARRKLGQGGELAALGAR